MIRSELGGEEGGFRIAIGKAAQAKHGFRVNDVIKGKSEPVADPRLETDEYYKMSGLKVLAHHEETPADVAPPWHGVAPDLEMYRERGHRRLRAATYEKSCTSSLWGCRMPVEMTIDHWNPSKKRYCFETFCYGPKSCLVYRAGPTRKVPGRHGMSWEEEDWIDEEDTAHRESDE